MAISQGWRASIDHPAPHELSDPLRVRLVGWVFHVGARTPVDVVEVLHDGRLVGSTRLIYDRPDVRQVHDLPDDLRTGFTVTADLAHVVGIPRAELHLRARAADHTEPTEFAVVAVALSTRDYRRNHHGQLLEGRDGEVWHRERIFGSGPSMREGSPECAGLIARYLGPPPCSVVDVGCGLGYYGRQLLAAGYAWMGVEIKREDCRELAAMGLPHQRVDGYTLPFPERSFDSAICIEVLEHIRDLDRFLAEIRRTIRSRLIVSVPNAELIPYLRDYWAVPWHVLEADHHNFFSRGSLAQALARHFSAVEVLDYAEHPLKTPDGLRLAYHLFAVATV